MTSVNAHIDPTCRPLNMSNSITFSSILFRTSTSKTNKKGDIGSPCLSPLPIFKGLDGAPLKKTQINAPERQDLMQPLNFWRNPIFSKTLPMLSQSIVSHAFSKSSFRRIPVFLYFFNQLTTSFAINARPKICVPLTNDV